MGLAVDGANRHDMKLVRATVDSLPVPRPAPTPDQPQGMCLDKGYDFDEVHRTLEEFITAWTVRHFLIEPRLSRNRPVVRVRPGGGNMVENPPNQPWRECRASGVEVA